MNSQPFPADQIIPERDAILNRMTADFEQREGSLGLCIRGSIAEGSADMWSDIDATIVVATDHYEQFTAERFSAPERWGRLLFNSGRMEPFLCISHFRPFVKLDLFYRRPEDLIPSPWYARPILIVFDRDGSIRRLIDQSKELVFRANPEEINSSINQAISCAHEVLRRAERGEFAYAQQILDEFRSLTADTHAFLSEAPAVGLAHFEPRCSDKHLLEVLRNSYPREHEKCAIIDCLKRLVTVYRIQVAGLQQRFALQRSRERDEECFDTVEHWPQPPQ